MTYESHPGYDSDTGNISADKLFQCIDGDMAAVLDVPWGTAVLIRSRDDLAEYRCRRFGWGGGFVDDRMVHKTEARRIFDLAVSGDEGGLDMKRWRDLSSRYRGTWGDDE